MSAAAALERVEMRSLSRRYLDEVETEPRERLEHAALERLREALTVAARRRFYRERLAHVDVGAIASFADFAAAAPTFRKQDLVAELTRTGGYLTGIEPQQGTPAAVALTSGTLGFPTFAVLGPGELDRGSAMEVLREFWMDGMRSGMRVMCQYPAWHHLSMLDNRALALIGANVLCPWGTFVPRHAGDAIELIATKRPQYLLTVTTMLHAIVAEALRRQINLGALFEPVRYAMVAGEPVSPGQRALLIELLDIDDLFERGGSSDGLWGGADCPAHRGHHVWWDHHHVEVLDVETGAPLGPGRRGSVVVTNLTTDRSLYVRFDTEDLGELLPGECPCGRTHPRVELYGRLADCVRCEGRLIAPYDVRALLDEIPPLVGVPLVVVGGELDSGPLQVRLDGDARGPGLAERAREHLSAALDLPVDVRFGGPLPKRWKARMAVGRTRGANTGRAGARTPAGGQEWRRR